MHKAEFCRHRLCPTCNWRKSLKLFSQMKEVSARLLQDFPGARYLFLTLTVKNCSGAELAQTIDKMNFGFKLLVNAGKTNASAKAVKRTFWGTQKPWKSSTMQKRPSRPKCTPSGKILHRARPKGWQREPELRHVPSTFSRTAHGETIFFQPGIYQTRPMGRDLAGLHEAGLHAASRHSGHQAE